MNQRRNADGTFRASGRKNTVKRAGKGLRKRPADPFMHLQFDTSDDGYTIRRLEVWGNVLAPRGFFASKGMRWDGPRRRWVMRNISTIDDAVGDILNFFVKYNARMRAKFPNAPRDPGEKIIGRFQTLYDAAMYASPDVHTGDIGFGDDYDYFES